MSTINGIFVGMAKPFGPKGWPSGMIKHAVTSAYVTKAGIAGDEQGDLVYHGGPEKTVHQYPYEHYDYWRAAGMSNELLDSPGSFGENVTTRGMTEATVCVGDVYRTGLGGPMLQLSEPRSPCWRLGVRFGLPQFPADVQRAGRTGWYYRTLEDGLLQTGAAFELIERPHPDWSLVRLLDVLYYHPNDRASLEEVAELRYLAEGLKNLARHRLEKASTESWTQRLTGIGRKSITTR